jgi:uncharacterized protein (DUF736 family)
MEKKKYEDELGALWIRMTKTGEDYLSGMLTIGGVATPVICFRNRVKKSPNQPDYRIMPAQKPAEEDEGLRPEDNPF